MADSGIADKEIIQKLKTTNNKDEVFSLLVAKYQERLYWHIRKMVVSHDDTDDILQNTFLKVWKALDSFKGDSSFYTWIYRIATNETFTFIKIRERQKSLSIDDGESSVINSLKSDHNFDGNELQMRLQKYILLLPAKQRLVFNMKYFDEMKYEDIAKITDNSIGALKASYHHAVKKLKAMFNDGSI
jgi:RNA polymerase sigma-70 factor (ECF subfamily)